MRLGRRSGTALSFVVLASAGWSSAWAQTASRPAEGTLLDLRAPMALAARAIVARLDPSQDYRPFFMIRGQDGVPHTPAHDSWDFADMTGRYLEGLIMARQMGVTSPELSKAEERLGKYLLSLQGPDGLIHNADSNEIDHIFSQGSALYGLYAWFESTGDPAARQATERLIGGLLKLAEKHDDYLTFPSVKLTQAPGSHLAGYCIWPAIKYYEATLNPDALSLAEGLTRWVVDHDPTIAEDGTVTQALSWEGHIHSWLDTYAGCLRTARISPNLDHARVLAKSRALYDWVRRTNSTDFGWFATFPTHGSCETCEISSAIRLALELYRSGESGRLNDVERFVRNQVLEAQFRNLKPLARNGIEPTPMLLGVFDSQSTPNSLLGTRGGDDVGTVEGCCLNGGMRAIFLAWRAAVGEANGDLWVNLLLSRESPWATIVSRDPQEGRVDVHLRHPARRLVVHIPDWVARDQIRLEVGGQARQGWVWIAGMRPAASSQPSPSTQPAMQSHMVIDELRPGQTITIRYPLRTLTETVKAGGQEYRVTWRGDTVTRVEPESSRDHLYTGGFRAVQDPAASRTNADPIQSAIRNPRSEIALVPDTYFLQDAAVACAANIIARLDAGRDFQPFFRIYPFADPPYASHEKWDDADMSGRYVEAMILARRMTGVTMDMREHGLRMYLAGLCDPEDGLVHTQKTDWTPRQACMFSQSSAMLGLIAWHDESGSQQVRTLLDNQMNGLMTRSVKKEDYSYYPKYEWDGERWIDDPKDKDAPAWYGGRVLLPVVEYWKRFPRPQVAEFIERLARYCMEKNPSISADGSVSGGEGWWGHLHGTQDMVAGIAEYGRLAGKPEYVTWAKRVYEWIGRTNTSRFGFMADVVGGEHCEACGIASRIRLGLVLYRAGAIDDPFGEIDRFVRNQLLEQQFTDVSFLKPLKPDTQATPGGQKSYANIDRMILGQFQCWATANDLIGHTDIEGCGAGGGMQALYLAWRNAVEWKGDELNVHLLFNRRVGATDDGPIGPSNPLALEIWSHLPYAGRVDFVAHRPLKLRVRLPDQTEADSIRLLQDGQESKLTAEAGHVRLPAIPEGRRVTLLFTPQLLQTQETAAGKPYHIRWKGSTVLSQEPRGEKVPVYAHRQAFEAGEAPLCAPRYP